MIDQSVAAPGGGDPLQRAAAGLASLAGWRRAAVCFLAGSLATLAMPPVGLIPILYVSFPALVWILGGCARRRDAFWAGWVFAFGYFFIGLYWINNAFLVHAGQYWFMVPLIGLGFPAALAIFGGLATLLAGMAKGLSGRALALAVAWAAMEWLRGNILTGFPWNLAGHAWAASDAMIQSAAVLGIYGTSLLALLSCSLAACLAGRNLRHRLLVGCLVLAIPGVSFLMGSVWLSMYAGRQPDAGPGLRIVQAGIPQKEKWRPDLRERNFRRHLELSVENRPDWVGIVIWPETATPFFFEEVPTARSLAAKMLPQGGVLLTGTPRRRTNPATLWNGMVAMDETGAVLETFDKFHLVPLGEYVPLSDYLPLPAIAASGIDYSPGPGPRTLRVGTVPPFSPLICYEVIFPGAVTDRADPPEWLLNMTNDAWYGSSAGPYQHLAMARIRAIEEGIPMVRAANTGISAVIDPFGRVTQSLPLHGTGVIDARLPSALHDGEVRIKTAYTRYGDYPYLVLLAAAALLAAWRTRVNRA